MEIVIFQNLFLSSRGWKNQLVKIFCGMESSKKEKKQTRAETLNSANFIFSSHTPARALPGRWGIASPRSSPWPELHRGRSSHGGTWGTRHQPVVHHGRFHLKLTWNRSGSAEQA